jgi:hypothetical protein
MSKNINKKGLKKKNDFKLAKRKYDAKFEDEIVDFFPESLGKGLKTGKNLSKDMTFNMAPILKPVLEKKAVKKNKKLKTEKKEKKNPLFVDSEEEDFENYSKGLGTQKTDIFIEDNSFFSTYKQDLISQFNLSKTELKKMSKIPNLVRIKKKINYFI